MPGLGTGRTSQVGLVGEAEIRSEHCQVDIAVLDAGQGTADADPVAVAGDADPDVAVEATAPVDGEVPRARASGISPDAVGSAAPQKPRMRQSHLAFGEDPAVVAQFAPSSGSPALQPRPIVN